jgi:hypothetical protein
MRRLGTSLLLPTMLPMVLALACEGRPSIVAPGATFREVTLGDGLATTRGTGGFAVGDIDGDGALDVVATSGYALRNTLSVGEKVAEGPLLLVPGASADEAVLGPEQALQGDDAQALAPLAADLDGDGDLDVMLPLGGPASAPTAGGVTRIYENDGGALVERGALELAATEGMPYALCPADFDRDGDLDVFVAKLNAQDRLYRNDGALVFVEVIDDAGSVAAPFGYTNACLAMDVDDDGDLDLFTAYEYLPQGVVLHRNDTVAPGGPITFTDVSVEKLGDATGHQGDWMGFAAGDPDGDLDVDVFVTNIGIGAYSVGGSIVTADPNGNALHMMLENQGDGSFRDTASAVDVAGLEPLPPAPFAYPAHTTGLAALEFGWTAWFFDYDNDGDEDLLFFGSWAFSSTWQIVGTREQGANPGRLLENDGSGAYREVGALAGLRNARSDFIDNGWGCDVVDFDRDGFLDVIVSNQYFGEEDHPQGLRVWLNEGNDNSSLDVELIGHASAPHAFGARVELTTRDASGNERTQMRARVSAAAISGASTAPLHFGLPRGTSPARLVVRWPSGARSELDGPFERRIVVEEPQ